MSRKSESEGSADMVRPQLSLLGPDQIATIHQSSIGLLETNGVLVYSREALDLLQEAGCSVDDRHVCIPEKVVQQALSTVPGSVEIFDRSGAPAMTLTSRNAYFGTGSDTPNVIDFDSGDRRPSVLQDVARAAHVADGLEQIDFIMGMGLAADVPVETSDRYHFAAMMRHSTKPIMFTAWSRENVQAIYNMAIAVRGDRVRLREKPFLIHYAMAIAPFVHPEDSLQKLMFCAEHHLPVEYHSVDIGGSTGPATLAGSFVQGNARMLSGLVIHQLKSPGAPLIVDTSVTFLDMRTMVPPYFAPEVMLASVMNKEMALYYGVPTFAKAGAGDAKVLDQQAGIEIGMTLYNEYLIGNNLIHDLGYLGSGMTASLESLVICDEVVGLVKRIGRGVDLSPQALALEAIAEAGPSGNYLTQEHTLEHFRREFWFPRLFDHGDYHRWSKDGGLNLAERAHQRAFEILSDHAPVMLNKEVDREIEKILTR